MVSYAAEDSQIPGCCLFVFKMAHIPAGSKINKLWPFSRLASESEGVRGSGSIPSLMPPTNHPECFCMLVLSRTGFINLSKLSTAPNPLWSNSVSCTFLHCLCAVFPSIFFFPESAINLLIFHCDGYFVMFTVSLICNVACTIQASCNTIKRKTKIYYAPGFIFT